MISVIVNLVLCMIGIGIGIRLTYRYIVIALIAYAAAMAIMEFIPSIPLGFAALIPGLVVLQLGYLVGVLAGSMFREWRRERR